jgi:hypothetical protein
MEILTVVALVAVLITFIPWYNLATGKPTPIYVFIAIVMMDSIMVIGSLTQGKTLSVLIWLIATFFAALNLNHRLNEH